MRVCIAIVCCVFGVSACNSDKSDSSTKPDPPKSTTPTVEPAGSGATAPTPADPHAGHSGSGAAAAPAGGNGPDCATEFDHGKAPDKHMACVECEKHRGHGSMEAECKNAIAKPWK